MGVGRNQYIDLMNQYRSKVRLVTWSLVSSLHTHTWCPCHLALLSVEVFSSSWDQGAAAVSSSGDLSCGAVVGGARRVRHRG